MKGMTTPFQVSEYNIRDLARNQQSIRIAVLGYWSNDPINVYIKRGWNDVSNWKFDIGVSSGGRDTEEVESDADAVLNFAAGLVEASRIVKELESQVDLIEAEYKVYSAECTARYEAEWAAKQARIDADTPIGETKAKEIVESLAETAKNKPYNEQTLFLFNRGTDIKSCIGAEYKSRVSFRFNSYSIKKADLIAKIAGMSSREVK